MIRAKRPSFNQAAIIYIIMTDLSTTYGPGIPTTKGAEDYVKELFFAMLFGVGLATGVALLIFPTSSRMVVKKRLKGLIGQLREITRLQRKFMSELAMKDEADLRATEDKEQEGGSHPRKQSSGKKVRDEGSDARSSETGKRLIATITATKTMLGQLYSDITFAKRDTAWGKLDAEDLSEVSTLIRNIIIPV